MALRGWRLDTATVVYLTEDRTVVRGGGRCPGRWKPQLRHYGLVLGEVANNHRRTVIPLVEPCSQHTNCAEWNELQCEQAVLE